jgi:predicted small lipoprotein YifL
MRRPLLPALIVLLATAALGGCGNKGPLVLPKPTPAPASSVAPVPAPASTAAMPAAQP